MNNLYHSIQYTHDMYEYALKQHLIFLFITNKMDILEVSF